MGKVVSAHLTEHAVKGDKSVDYGWKGGAQA